MTTATEIQASPLRLIVNDIINAAQIGAAYCQAAVNDLNEECADCEEEQRDLDTINAALEASGYRGVFEAIAELEAQNAALRDALITAEMAMRTARKAVNSGASNGDVLVALRLGVDTADAALAATEVR